MFSGPIVFAGTPDFAAIILQRLIHEGHFISAVYTQPDRKSGRGRKTLPSSVKKVAIEHNIPVYQPASLKSEADQQQLAQLEPALMIVAAYGLILPQLVLDIPTLGCINVHASLLPRWRGAAPIQRAIQAGDSETGITLMRMEAGLDTGPMLSKSTTPIYPDDTGASLHDRLAEQGAQLMAQALPGIEALISSAQPQTEALANYAHKLEKNEAQINWQQPAESIERQIRAFNGWPVASSELAGVTLRIWEAAALEDTTHELPGTLLEANKQGITVSCGEGTVLALTTMQMPGKKPLSAALLLNGQQALFQPGAQFYQPKRSA